MSTRVIPGSLGNGFGLRRKVGLLCVTFAALVIVAVLVMASPAHAADLVVTSNADSGTGTLRAAVNTTNGNGVPDTITFNLPSSQRTITLTSGQITFTSNSQSTTIDGGTAGVTVSGNNATRVFSVNSGALVNLKGLTVANGLGPKGGGIANSGTLNVSDSTFSNNSASGYGGGIANEGTLTVGGSTFSNNSANSHGGGIYTTSTFGPDSTTIENSTISGNSANYGGGVYNSRGQTTITSTTITKNSAPDNQGAGVASNAGTSEGTYTDTVVGSSIIAGNSTTDVDFTSGPVNSFSSKGYNVIGDGNATKAFNYQTTPDQPTTDQTNVSNPGLGPLADNGGPTQTHALLTGSPAIDKGNTTLTTDQRGKSRPFDVPHIDPASGGNNSDVGSHAPKGCRRLLLYQRGHTSYGDPQGRALKRYSRREQHPDSHQGEVPGPRRAYPH